MCPSPLTHLPPFLPLPRPCCSPPHTPSRVVIIEKHWADSTPRSVCDFFWDEVRKHPRKEVSAWVERVGVGVCPAFSPSPCRLQPTPAHHALADLVVPVPCVGGVRWRDPPRVVFADARPLHTHHALCACLEQDVHPVITAPKHFLINVFRNSLFLVAAVTKEVRPPRAVVCRVGCAVLAVPCWLCRVSCARRAVLCSVC
jgi:hypothetical protein